jgi:hypothetical protein
LKNAGDFIHFICADTGDSAATYIRKGVERELSGYEGRRGQLFAVIDCMGRGVLGGFASLSTG